MKKHCALTLKEADLVQSHIYPKFVYRELIKDGGSGFYSSGNIDYRYQDGYKRPLLSKEAEQLFNNRGETWFANKVFYPYFANNGVFDNRIAYDEHLFYFAVSLLWRCLYENLEELGDRDYPYKSELRQAYEEWRMFLYKDIFPDNYNRIYFHPTGQFRFPEIEYSQYYFERMCDSTIFYDNESNKCAIYCKLPQFSFWSIINETEPKVNWGLRINPIKGKIDFKKYRFAEIYLIQFYANRILQTNKIIKESGMSEVQLNKISQRIKNNIDHFDESQLANLLINKL